jgi:type IV secretory pathway component VirB8
MVKSRKLQQAIRMAWDARQRLDAHAAEQEQEVDEALIVAYIQAREWVGHVKFEEGKI